MREFRGVVSERDFASMHETRAECIRVESFAHVSCIKRLQAINAPINVPLPRVEYRGFDKV